MPNIAANQGLGATLRPWAFSSDADQARPTERQAAIAAAARPSISSRSACSQTFVSRLAALPRQFFWTMTSKHHLLLTNWHALAELIVNPSGVRIRHEKRRTPKQTPTPKQ